MNDRYPNEPTTALVVAGMHRSGTSAITRVLSLLGAKLPDNLMAAHSKFNPTGFWESKDVVSINDRLLASAESHWDEMYAFDIDALTPTTLTQFHADISTLLEHDFTRETCFVIKDPRIARTLPLWLEALRRLQHDVKIIITVRHPLEVAASLADRDGFSIDKSVYLWLRYMLDSIRYAANDGYGIVVYDELIRDWRASIERLRQELQITWPIDITTASPAIDQFLNRDLRHHELSTINWEYEGHALNPIAEMASQIYDALLCRAPDLLILALDIQKKLASLETIYRPLLMDYRKQHIVDLTHQEELNQALLQACRNVTDLEHILNDERRVYKNLEAEFITKCNHVRILQEDIAGLKLKIGHLQAGNKHVETCTLEDKKSQFRLLSQLQDIEFLVREKQGQLFAQQQAMHSQQRQFKDEITRADAQLSLLKDLFLERLR